eukprot:8934335-Pyramimonas_sp.AAC.1
MASGGGSGRRGPAVAFWLWSRFGEADKAPLDRIEEGACLHDVHGWNSGGDTSQEEGRERGG